MKREQNREVGIVATLAVSVLGLVSGQTCWYPVAIALLLAAILMPVVYTPLSRLWLGFGRLGERFFSMILLTLVFYLLVTPVALGRRRFAEDTLSVRRFKKGKKSVFVRKNRTYRPEDLEKQY